MNTQITLGQLIMTILVIIGGVLGVYLAMLVYQLFKAVQKINSILDSNKENIDNTMKSIPGIVENVNVITGSVKQKTELIDSFFGDKAEAPGASGISSLESIISVVSSIIEIFNEARNFFHGKKKKIFKIKR
jgi:predicted PurR-regulated permease PerM